MIGFLRFIGLINAALWLGAAIFFSVVAAPAVASPAMEQLLGPKNFPFFSDAVAHIIASRYFIFLGATSVIAVLHLLAEWLYMGRPTRKFSTLLLGGLIALVLIGGVWIEPRVNQLHLRRHAPNAQPAERDAAAKTFRLWHAGFLAFNVSMIAGLVIYTWRAANPSDSPRFISSVKFRG